MTTTSAATSPDSPPPTGGPAALTGFLYQLLASVDWATALVLSRRPGGRQGWITSMLTLEPRGSDAIHAAPGERQTLQFKSRSRPWTLTALIKEVMPNLYVATENEAATAYRLQSNAASPPLENLAALQATLRTTELEQALATLGKRKIIFRLGRRALKPRAFFDQAGAIASGLSIKAFRADSVARERFARLLRYFAVTPPLSLAEMQASVLSRLGELVIPPKTADSAYHELLGRLLDDARKGHREIVVADLLARCGVDVPAAERMASFSRTLSDLLDMGLDRSGYQDQRDCRDIEAPAVVDRPVAFAGPSGVGKTWMLGRTASAARRRGELVIWIGVVPEGGDIRRQVTEILQTAAGHGGEPVNIERLGTLIGGLSPDGASPSILVCLDRFATIRQAVGILGDGWWAQQGLRVAAALPASAPDVVATQDAEVIAVPDFTPYEVRRLFGDLRLVWKSMPGDVRALVQRPFLADLYRTLVQEDGLFSPQTEYELVAAAWVRRPTSGHLGEWRDAKAQLDANMHALLEELLAGRSPEYPWSVGRSGWSSAQRDLLEGVGLIRWADEDHVQLDHDRLLAWGLSKAIVSQYQAGRINLEQTTDLVLSGLIDGREKSLLPGRALGYVPMDVLWLLTDADQDSSEDIMSLVLAISASPPRDFRWETLATLGSRAFRLLLRVAETFGEDQLRRKDHVAAAMASAAPASPASSDLDRVGALLVSEEPYRREIAMRYLSRRPEPQFLDLLVRKAGELFRQPPEEPTFNFYAWYAEKTRVMVAFEAAIKFAPATLAALLDGMTGEEAAAAAHAAAAVLEPDQIVQIWQSLRERTESADRLHLDQFLLGIANDADAISAVRVSARSGGWGFTRLSETQPDEAFAVFLDLPRETLLAAIGNLGALVRARPECLPVVVAAIRSEILEPERVALACASWSAQDDGSVTGALIDSVTPHTEVTRRLSFLARAPNIATIEVLQASSGKAFETLVAEAAIERTGHVGPQRQDRDYSARESVLLRIGGQGFAQLTAAQLRYTDHDIQRRGLRNALIVDETDTVLSPLVTCVEAAMAGNEKGIPLEPLEILAAIAPAEASAMARRVLGRKTQNAAIVVAETALHANDPDLAMLALEGLDLSQPGGLAEKYHLVARFGTNAVDRVSLAHQLLATGRSDNRALAAHAAAATQDGGLIDAVSTALLIRLQSQGDGHDSQALAYLMETSARPVILAELRTKPSRGVFRSMIAELDEPEIWKDRRLRDQALQSALDLESTFLNTPREGLQALWEIDRDVAFDAFDESLRRGGRAAFGAVEAIQTDAARALAVMIDRAPLLTDEKTIVSLGRALRGHPRPADVAVRVIQLIAGKDGASALIGAAWAGWLGDDAVDDALIDAVRRSTRPDVRKVSLESLKRSDQMRFLQKIHSKMSRAGAADRRRLLAIALEDDGDQILARPQDPLSVEPFLDDDRMWLLFDRRRKR